MMNLSRSRQTNRNMSYWFFSNPISSNNISIWLEGKKWMESCLTWTDTWCYVITKTFSLLVMLLWFLFVLFKRIHVCSITKMYYSEILSQFATVNGEIPLYSTRHKKSYNFPVKRSVIMLSDNLIQSNWSEYVSACSVLVRSHNMVIRALMTTQW